MLADPHIAPPTLAVIAGLFLLVDGIIETVWLVSWTLVGDRAQGRFLAVMLAIVTAIVGVLLIRHPTHAVVAIVLLLGFWLMIFGMVRLVSTRDLKSGRGWEMALAALEFVAFLGELYLPPRSVATAR